MDETEETILLKWMKWRSRGQAEVGDFKTWSGINKLLNVLMDTELRAWKNEEDALKFLHQIGIDLSTPKKGKFRLFRKTNTKEKQLQALLSIFIFDLKRQLKNKPNENPETSFLAWINDRYPDQFQVSNFTEQWASGKALAGLVEYFCTESFPSWATWSEKQGERLHNVTVALERAYTHLGIEKWISPETLIGGSVSSLVMKVFLSQFIILESPSSPPISPSPFPDPRRQTAAFFEPGPNVRRYTTPGLPQTQPPDVSRQVISFAPGVLENQSGGKLRFSEFVPSSVAPSGQQTSRLTQVPSLEEYPVEMAPSRQQTSRLTQLPSLEEYPVEMAPSRQQNECPVEKTDTTARPSRDRKSDKSGNPRNIYLEKSGNEEGFWQQFPEDKKSFRQKLTDVIKSGELTIFGNISGESAYEARFAHPEKGYQIVAAKSLKGNESLNDVINGLNEALMMRNFHHQNVMELICVTFCEGWPYALLPLMKNGDLYSLLTEKTERLGEKLSDFTLDIARGMKYLHDQRFVHRHLNTSHCLLDDQNKVKIYNFTHTRDTGIAGNYEVVDPRLHRKFWRWSAPETLGVLDGSKNAGLPADVWSYGVVLWEIYSYGSLPYQGVDDVETMKEYLREGQRLSRPPEMPDEVYDLAKRCWLPDPRRRPTFRQLLESDALSDPGYSSLQPSESTLPNHVVAQDYELPIGEHYDDVAPNTDVKRTTGTPV